MSVQFVVVRDGERCYRVPVRPSVGRRYVVRDGRVLDGDTIIGTDAESRGAWVHYITPGATYECVHGSRVTFEGESVRGADPEAPLEPATPPKVAPDLAATHPTVFVCVKVPGESSVNVLTSVGGQVLASDKFELGEAVAQFASTIYSKEPTFKVYRGITNRALGAALNALGSSSAAGVQNSVTGADCDDDLGDPEEDDE